MSEYIPAEAFHPGEFIADELEARGWAQKDLAHIMGEKPNVISDLIAGKRDVSPKYARLLAGAFGTSIELWLNLQATYEVASNQKQDENVVRRAAVYEKAPIREMQKRGWIGTPSDIDELEGQVCQFLEIGSLDETPAFNHAARKSTDYGQVNASQLAWLMRSKKLAEQLSPDTTFSTSEEWCSGLLGELYELRGEVERVDLVSSVLSRFGIRLVIVEHLPKTKIDGACFWLDPESPAIALSLRFDRIDCFWHSLMHEISHVLNGDGQDSPLLENLFDDSDPSMSMSRAEKAADKFAVEYLVDQPALTTFVKRQKPYFSRASILEFSASIDVHAGIVVGQLHHRHKMGRDGIPFSNLRGLLVKIRDAVTTTALTDGWGRTVAV